MKRRRLILILLLLAAPPLYLAILSAYLLNAGAQDTAQKADAIIIFGARVKEDGKASRILHARTRHAFELWKAGLAPQIVCTGGLGGYPPAEAIVQRDLLEGWGVPPKDILIDDKSTSTKENARNAAALLPHGAKVIAVSEAFHLWRCRRDCSRSGLQTLISAEEPGWEQLFPYQRFYYSVREAALVTRDCLFG